MNIKNLNTIALEKIYLWLAIPIGLMFLFLMPPFQVPDEGAHYFKALSLAQGQITCAGQVSAPVNYVSLVSDTQLVKIKGENGKKISGTKMKEALTTPASSESVIIPQAICNVYPIGHIVQAIGLKIGILSHAPPLIAFYLGRLLIFAVAIFLVYSAIRIAPFGKIIFLIIGLLPMTMQQLGSFSYDALSFGLIFLFSAYLLNLANNGGKLSTRNSWLLLGLSLLAFNAKPGYFLLAFLIFILPKAKFENVKKYWMYMLGFVFASFLFFGIGQMMLTGSNASPKGINPQAQAMFVLSNPIEFSYILFHSLYKNHTFYFESFLLKPGWMNSSLPDLLYVFMTIGIVLLLRSKDEIVNLNKNQRLIIFLVFLMQTLFVFLSLYLVWTEVGESRIQGVQGRYLLAIFPLFILSFYKSKFSFRSDWIRKNIPTAFVIFILITFIFTFLNIIGLYYKDISSYLN